MSRGFRSINKCNGSRHLRIIDIALRYFIMTHYLPNNITPDMVMQLPGDLKDRLLGKLNLIFPAITDIIAWTAFPRDLFTRFYRSDFLIASLFRNFLLAERIMKNYHCTPHTYPLLLLPTLTRCGPHGTLRSIYASDSFPNSAQSTGWWKRLARSFVPNDRPIWSHWSVRIPKHSGRFSSRKALSVHPQSVFR